MSNASMPDSDVLKYAVENGIIDMALVQANIKMQKKKDILQSHNYSVWYGKDGYWHTYLLKKGKRQHVKKKTQEDIENAIIEYYESLDVNTFKERFDIWKERQKICGRDDNTISKYESDYKRFFAGHDFENIPIKQITEEEICNHIRNLLSSKKIPYRALQSMFGYMNGVFDKSIRDRIIETNYCDYVDLPIFKKMCTEPKPKSTKERTVSNDEISIILSKIHSVSQEDINIAWYAIELSIYTGMRVGELAGLKWEDINYDERVLIIQRSEKYNRKSKEYYISTPKNCKIRVFPLTKEIEILLQKIYETEKMRNCLSEYVFSDENGKVNKSRISDCARNLTMSKEFDKTKSVQALRRTLNSKLRTSGVSRVVASSLLGHTEEVNDKNYTYDLSEIDYKISVLEDAYHKV